MKPYVTIEQRPDGQLYLPLQLQGVERGRLAALLRGRRLLACKLPKMQTAGSAWQVILIFDADMSFELTSSSTVAQGWDEFGTINVEVLAEVADESMCEWENLQIAEDLVVVRAEIVRWQGTGLIVDSGIRFHFADNRTFSVVACDVPGALLLTMPGEVAPPFWQFSASEYTSVVID